VRLRQPVLKDPVPFDAKPRGPFFCCIGPRPGKDIVPGDVAYDTLDQAVDVLAREAMPPQPSQIMGVVCDRYGVVVVGWNYDRPGRPQWFGVRCGFEALGALGVLPPAEFIFAEVEAQAAAPS
jgi:hypothetical protein